MVSPRLYWDTSVFLCFLNQNEEDRRAICEDILQEASNNKVHIVTSTYTIVEVIRPKRRAIANSRKLGAEEIAKIKGMFRWPFITTIELDDRTAFYASGLARDHGLLPADSVHGASAILWKADVLQAWDRDFSSISNLIAVESPQFVNPQRKLKGMESPPIGPRPEDFKIKD